MPYEEKINSLFIITDNLIKTNQNFNDNISNIETELNKISQDHENINNEISKISEEIVEKEINSQEKT